MQKRFYAMGLAFMFTFTGVSTGIAAYEPVSAVSQSAIMQSVEAWKANSTYKVGQQVSFDGKLYECIVDHARLKPTTKYVWKCLGEYQAIPNWVKGTKYVVGNKVSYEGKVYLCIVDHVRLSPKTAYVWKCLG